MRALAVLVLMLLAVSLLPPIEAGPPMTLTIEGPTAVAPKTPQRYTITVTGGPREDQENGTFSIEYYIPGDITGATPPQDSPGQATNESGTFTIDITTPASDAVFTLVVVATSKHGVTQANETATRSLVIEAKTPIVLQASFKNTGTAAVLGVDVDFYVDGHLVGSETVARIDPQGTARVNHTWIPVGIAEGTHAVRIEADLDGDGEIDPSGGEVSIDEFFTRQTAPLPPYVTVLAVTGIVLLGVIVILLIRGWIRRGR